jgi:hypothetical protein
MNFAASRLRVRIGNAPYGASRLRRLHLACAEGDEFARRINPTGGLRPPLLLQYECLPAKNDFCDTHTHIRSGAAGVSPPWFTKRTCNAVRFTFGKPRLQRKPRSDRRGPISRTLPAVCRKRTCVSGSSPTVGSRRPLLVAMTADVRDARLYFPNSTRLARLAYVSHSWCGIRAQR